MMLPLESIRIGALNPNCAMLPAICAICASEWCLGFRGYGVRRSEEHTSELQSPCNLVCRLLLEKKKNVNASHTPSCLGGRRVRRPSGAPRRPRRRASATRARQRSRGRTRGSRSVFFFFNDTATTEIYTLSLHDALPI